MAKARRLTGTRKEFDGVPRATGRALQLFNEARQGVSIGQLHVSARLPMTCAGIPNGCKYSRESQANAFLEAVRSSCEGNVSSQEPQT